MSERQQDSITHSRTCEECGRQTYQFERCHHCGDVPWKANRSWDTLGRLWERVTTSETTLGLNSDFESNWDTSSKWSVGSVCVIAVSSVESD